MFDWGEKRPKQNFSSDFEVRTVEEAQPYKEYYIPASGLNPMQTIEYTNTANEKNNEWKAGKAFYNGFVVNAGRGILGTLAMLRDYNIASRPDVKPMAEGVAILDNALNSSVLQPYDVKGETELGQFGLDLTTGAGQLASQVLATILTGGAAGTAFMASNIAGNQYLDLRKDGVDVSTAAGASVTNALVQAPLERFSVGKILTKLPAGSPLKKKAKQIVETAVTEGITEFVQQYPEEITNYVAKNTGKSVEELAASADVGEWTKNAAYAGLLGAVLGGGAGSINVALQRNVNKQQQADFEEEIEVAKKSGAKADFIAALTDQQTNNDTVEVDAESIVTFAQENIGKVAENLGINAETIQKAAAEGTSIEITKGKLMQTELNVPGFYQAVKDDIDFTASGYTVNREKLQKELQKEYQIINKQEEELQVWKDEKLAEMRKAGMNKAEALDAITLLTSAARTARPDNPLQFLKEYPLVFERMVRTPKGSYPQYKQSGIDNKQKQLDIILKTNPMQDDYHVGVRELSDIRSSEEVFGEDNFEELNPDFTVDMAQEALESGFITVYSSKPIELGGFVSSSQMMAKDYAGRGKVYSKEVPINDVAWIDEAEGQYAPASEYDNIFKQGEQGSYPQYKQTSVKDNAFKKWFGDSKVVDEKGNPIVLYHGTMNNTWIEYDASKKNQSHNTFANPNNIYLTTSENVAKSYISKEARQYDYKKLEKSLKTDVDAINIPDDIKIFKKITVNDKEYLFECDSKGKLTGKYIEDITNPQAVTFRSKGKLNNAPKELFEKAEKKRSKEYFAIKKVGDNYNVADTITDFPAQKFDGKRGGFIDDLKLALYNNDYLPQGSGVMRLYAKLENPFIVDYKGQSSMLPLEVDGKTFGTEGINGIRSIVEIENYARQNGYDGVVAKNVIDEGGERKLTSDEKIADTIIVFDRKNIKSVDNQGTFSSDTANIYQQGERGQIGWDAEGKAIIGLFDTADASTFIHEAMGHYLANVLAKEAAKPNANPQIIKDFETMLKYAGTTRERWEYLNSKRRYGANLKLSQTAYHGTPHSFDTFDLGAIGTGEGAQAHGWGLYFAKDRNVAQAYKDVLGADKTIIQTTNTSYLQNEDGDWIDGNTNNVIEYGSALSYALEALDAEKTKGEAIKDLEAEIEKRKGNNTQAAKNFIVAAKEAVNILNNNQFNVVNNSRILEVDIPNDEFLLDEQKNYFEQSEEVKTALAKAGFAPIYQETREWVRNEYGANAVKELDRIFKPLANGVAGLSSVNKKLLLDKYGIDEETAQYISRELIKYGDGIYSATGEHLAINSGRGIYQYFTDLYASDRAASLHLNKNGIKGITYEGIVDGRCFVVFDDKAINVINTYNQSANEQQGTEQFVDDTNVPSDMLTKAEDAELVRIQEAWATAAEQYFLEGKAPSKELQGAFRRFKNWLIDIYQTIQNFIATNQYAIPINDEVREVFDRMLASEYEIQQQERVNGYFSKLPSVITDNLSDKTKAQLQGYIEKAHDKAVDLLTKQSLVNFTVERKERIAEYRAEILPSVEEEIAQQPLYVASNMAIDMLNVKTARAAAQRYYDLLERSYDINKEPLSTKEKTELNTFDMIAEETGYTSGDELAQAIMDNPSQSQAVKQRADELVQKKFPDIMKERELAEQQAREAIYNDDSGLVLAIELQLITEQSSKALAKQVLTEQQQKQRAEEKAAEREQRRAENERNAEQRAKLARAMRQNARNAAKEELANMVIGEAIKTRKYITAERNFAAKAAVAMSKKQYEEAQQYKRMQMFNHEMVQESIKIKQRVEGYQRYINRQRKAKKETWLNETHFNQAADLLARMGIVRKDYDPTTKTQTLAEYCNEMQELYDNVAIADWIIQDSKSLMSPNRNLTVDEYEDVVNALKNIKVIANSERGLMAFGTNLDMREFFAEATENLSKLKTKYTPVVGERVKPSAIDQYKASLRSTDNFFEMMDGWKYGFFSKAFGESVKNATDNETTRVLDVQDATAKAYKEWLPTKEAAMQAEQKVYYEELKTSVDRHVLTKLLMNLGNESNARVLCSTPPIGLENSPLWVKADEEISQDEAILQTKQNLIEFLSSVLTEADVKYAQAKIDIANKYWQEMSDLERRWTGFTPKKVEAAPFTMVIAGKEIVFKGGYFPLIRDSDLGSKPAAKDTVSDLDTQQGKNVRTLHTARGHFKERVKTSYPIDLKRGSEFKVMQDAIHDLCFREVVGDFRKLLNNQDMYALMKTKLGIADMQAFREYCEKVAQPYSIQNADVAENWIGSAAGWLRRKTVNAVIMLNLKTAIQNFGNILLYGNVADGFGYKDVLASMGNYYMNMQTPEGYNSTKEFVYAKSSFMRERSDTPDITLRDLREENKLNPIEQKTMEWGTKLLVGTDNMTALPVWVQAYKKKLNAGATDKEAVNFADMIIRRTLGSSRITDVSPILRGGPLMKLLTTFQTFFNAQYNQWAREYNIFLRDKDAARLIQFVASKYIMACMLNLMLSFTDPFDDENDDGYMNITEELLKYPLGMLGPIGQAGTFILQKAIDMKTYSYRLSPIQSTVEQTARAAATISGAVQGEKEVKDAVEAATGIAGIVYGVPTQINKLFFNAYDILFNGMDTQAQDLFKRRPVKER